jgi:hypothetical protein
MKVSKHDKNLLMITQLTEVMVKSIIDEAKKNMTSAPDEKKPDYQKLINKYRLIHSQIIRTNDELEDGYKEVMNDDEYDLLITSVLGVALLLENQRPKQIVRLLESVGIGAKEIVERYQ